MNFLSFIRSSWKRLTFWGASSLVLFSLLGCSITGKQSTLDPKGPLAQNQMDIFMVTVWVSLFIFVVVGGILVWVVIRYRERPGDEDKPLPHSGHGNPLIEIGLIGGSVFLLVIIAVPTLEGIWFAHELPEDPESKLGAYFSGDLAEGEDENVLEITVKGYQWWFGFEYPQFGFTTGNEMVIPKGKVVKLNLRSDNVIHSYWLPKVAGKVDLMPGRRNWMWIQSDEVGHYYGQCAEFCGEAHAYMLFRTDTVEPEEFEKWVAEQQKGAEAPGGFKAQTADATLRDNWTAWAKLGRENPEAFANDPISRGAKLFMGDAQCIMCHNINNSPAAGILGPDLSFLGERRSLAAGIMEHISDDGGIDSAKQFDNIYNWVSKSQYYKPGNLMYYTTSGLMNLKFAGLTYEKLQQVGVTDDQLLSAITKEQLAAIKVAPDQPVNGADISQPRMLRLSNLVGEKDSLTFNDFIAQGINEKSIAAKISEEDFQAMKANASEDISKFVSNREFKELNTLYKDEVISTITRWPSDQDFRDITAFLQSLE